VARGDNTVADYNAMAGEPDPTEAADHIDNWCDLGTRGETWKNCEIWYPTMPGCWFQLAMLWLYLGYYGEGKNYFAASYTNFCASVAFLVIAIWGGVNIQGVDIVVWGIVIALVNAIKILINMSASKRFDDVFDGDMQTVYNNLFAPFEYSKDDFVDLVTVKGCDVKTLPAGQNYAIEGKTTTDRLSYMFAGKMKVSVNDEFLHYVNVNDFIDSPEWETIRLNPSKKDTYKVTIEAVEPCRFITWKKKPLLALLAKHKDLAKVLSTMIGRDVVRKLYALNKRRMNERGYNYDIRLPCIISLKDEVEEREAKRVEAQASPRQQRQRKLGNRAQEEFSRLQRASVKSNN
jgi:CRP-like cAMP-binding protein